MMLNIRAFPASPVSDGGEVSIPFSHMLDLSGIRRWGEHIFPKPVLVEGILRQYHGEITVDYKVGYELAASCARCLAPVVEKGDNRFRHTVSERAEDDAPEHWASAPEGMLDLVELVGSDLLLSLSGTQLCSQDCKGLCPHCGGNLNQNDCGCASLSKPTDPRFEALLKFIDE